MREQAMQLVETKISETSVSMRYADNADPQQAVEWIEFRMPVAQLKTDHGHKFGAEIEGYFLAEVRLAALRYVRDIIGGETQRLSGLAGRIR
jgi:hypothetical protein